MISLCLEGLHNDGIGTSMVSQHEVLVSIEGSDGEATKVIFEQGGESDVKAMEFIG